MAATGVMPWLARAGRKGDLVLLCHPHVKKAAGKGLAKELQPRSIFHGCGDGADLGIGGGSFAQSLAEGGGERRRRRDLRVGHIARAGGGHTVVLTGVFLGGRVTLALGGHDVQKEGPCAGAEIAQRALQRLLIVAVQRPEILESHILEHGGMVHGPPHHGFCLTEKSPQGRPRSGAPR